MQKLTRAINYYEKENEEAAGEIVLPEDSLNKLQKIFQRPNDDLMYEIYPISLYEANELTRIFNIDFNLEQYDYFLDCYVDNT